jgi:VCBS repeat-containing protein
LIKNNGNINEPPAAPTIPNTPTTPTTPIVNNAPLISSPASAAADEDILTPITSISVSDADNDVLHTQISVSHGTLTVTLGSGVSIIAGSNNSASITLSGLPSNTNAVLATLQYQGEANFNGADVLTISATDQTSTPLTTSKTIAIVVNPIDDGPPLAVADTNSVTEDSIISASGNVVTGTGADAAGADIFIDAVTVTHVTGITGGTVGNSVAGLYGSLLLNSDGSYTYTLNNTLTSVQNLNTGQQLLDTFTYTITDQDGQTSSTSLAITVTVNGVNDIAASAPLIGDNAGRIPNSTGLLYSFYNGNANINPTINLSSTASALEVSIDTAPSPNGHIYYRSYSNQYRDIYPRRAITNIQH